MNTFVVDGVTTEADGTQSDNNKTRQGSVGLIVGLCLAAAVLLLAVAFVVRRRSVKAKQHRSESMPSIVADVADA